MARRAAGLPRGHVPPTKAAMARTGSRGAGTRGGGALRWLRFALALAAFAAGLLTVLPPQSYGLFQARLVANEGSVWVVIVAALLLVTARQGRLGRAVAMASVAALAMAAVPIVRAVPVARALPEVLSDAFGPMPASPAASIGRETALSVPDLVMGLGLDELTPRTYVYAKVGGHELEMDVFVPPSQPSTLMPGVFVIHGGSWKGGSRAEFSGLSRFLAARGYVVAAIDYRLAPRYPFPAQRDDVAAALAAFQAHAVEYGLDPSRVVLLGRSAGAQLALLAAYTPGASGIRGVVSFYGPTDLVYGFDHPADPAIFDSTSALTTFLGGTPDDKRSLYRAASPIEFVSARTPPTLLVHGGPDELVEIEQSRRLDRRLAEAGVPHLLVELPWASHGCDYFLRGPCGQISTYAVEQFLARVTADRRAN
jgi:acetyl esterase/lipase